MVQLDEVFNWVGPKSVVRKPIRKPSVGCQEAQRKPRDLCRRRKCAGLAVHVLACLHVRLHTRYTSLTTRLVRYDAPDQPCSMGNVRALGAAGKAVVNMCFAVWRTPCCPQACGRFARPRNLARMRRTLHIAGIKFIPPRMWIEALPT